MKEIMLPLFVVCIAFTGLLAQTTSKKKVFTSDIDNFWIAYDSIKTTTDSSRQLQFINNLYINKGTAGLKAFMQARDYSAVLWVKLIRAYPKFWNSVRPNTILVKTKAKEIDASIARFKQLYPELKEAKIYFTVGGLPSGGTTMSNMVLIGTEITTGNATTDVSEFPDKWLAGVFREQSQDNTIALNIHEYVHTQQSGETEKLLPMTIAEGSCDFITELVMNKPMHTVYINYGKAHEAEIKEQFKKEMFNSYYRN